MASQRNGPAAAGGAAPICQHARLMADAAGSHGGLDRLRELSTRVERRITMGERVIAEAMGAWGRVRAPLRA